MVALGAFVDADEGGVHLDAGVAARQELDPDAGPVSSGSLSARSISTRTLRWMDGSTRLLATTW